jgi:hypothetical protein
VPDRHSAAIKFLIVTSGRFAISFILAKNPAKFIGRKLAVRLFSYHDHRRKTAAAETGDALELVLPVGRGLPRLDAELRERVPEIVA